MAQRARTDIELMRIVASLAVVTIHVSAGVLDSSLYARGSTVHLTSLILNQASRFSVPLFFAISGWTFLVASPVPSARALGTRILRVLVPLLAWSVIYGLAADRGHLSLAVLPRVAWMFVTGSNVYHFWFLYAYVPLFLALGLLTFVVRGARIGRDVLVTLGALLALVASTSLFQLVASLTGAPHATPSGWYAPPFAFGYALLGAVLLASERSEPRLRAGGAAIYGVAVVASVAWALRAGHAIPGDYGSVVSIAATLGALLFLRGWSFGPRASRAISAIARASFGLYLVHLLVLNGVARLAMRVPFFASDTGWGGVARVPVCVAATFTISLAASLAWGQSATLRKLLG